MAQLGKSLKEFWRKVSDFITSTKPPKWGSISQFAAAIHEKASAGGAEVDMNMSFTAACIIVQLHFEGGERNVRANLFHSLVMHSRFGIKHIECIDSIMRKFYALGDNTGASIMYLGEMFKASIDKWLQEN